MKLTGIDSWIQIEEKTTTEEAEIAADMTVACEMIQSTQIEGKLTGETTSVAQDHADRADRCPLNYQT